MKTSIVILILDNHNKNPAILAIKDLNNITQFEKPVPVILNRTAGIGSLCSKGDNPLFRGRKLPNVLGLSYMATYHPKSSWVSRNHIYASDMNKKSQDKLKRLCSKKAKQRDKARLLIQIRSVSRTKRG